MSRWRNTITKEVEVEFDLEDVLDFIENATASELEEIKKACKYDFPEETDITAVLKVPNLAARLEVEEFYEQFKKKWHI